MKLTVVNYIRTADDFDTNAKREGVDTSPIQVRPGHGLPRGLFDALLTRNQPEPQESRA